MYDYSGLEKQLRGLDLNRSGLGKRLGISSRTIAKIAKGEKLSRKVLERIAGFLGVAPGDLYEEKSDNPLLQVLREEKSAGISGGIYHELQVRLTYNSNHIEGSQLTESQTRLIFETNTVGLDEAISVDDILETVHHFRAIDYCIDHAEEPLTADFIKELHRILKHATMASRLGWFAVGDYKTRPNVVGGRETTPPRDVAGEMRKLLEWYGTLPSANIHDIIAFHGRFERIHPFQDGNGRVGRLIAFWQCLAEGIVPFLIDDSKKRFYYRGLANWDEETVWLTDTCLDGQDTMRAILEAFDIPMGDE